MKRRRSITTTLVAGLLLIGCGDGDASFRDARSTSSTTADDAPEDRYGRPEADDEPSGAPGMENIGVGERVTVRVLDEDGDVVAGERP